VALCDLCGCCSGEWVEPVTTGPAPRSRGYCSMTVIRLPTTDNNDNGHATVQVR
jgi:hypothetical protein